jgi:two-component system response regulator (stage 0 sporulation protein F)
MSPLQVLVVDDEQSICLLLQDVLTRFGHNVATCQDGESALTVAQERSFDLILLDIRMPGMDGLEALRRLRRSQPEAMFVMITGYAKDDVIDQALQSGASACLCKPFSLAQVKKLLDDVTSGTPVSV